MRIITNSLESISGLDILATGSLLVFFILFLWIIYRIARTSKKDAKKWGDLPFDNDLRTPETNCKESKIREY